MSIFTNLMFYCVMPLCILFVAFIIIGRIWGDRILNRIYRDERKHSFDQHIKEHWGDAD